MVDPLSLESTLDAGEIVTQALTIRNGNGVTLTYQIQARMPSDNPWLSVDPVSGTVLANGSQQVAVSFDTTVLQPRGIHNHTGCTKQRPVQAWCDSTCDDDSGAHPQHGLGGGHRD